MSNAQNFGRLAIRSEGNFLNAYFAPTDTMEGANFLGSIHMLAVLNNENRRQQFIALMSDFVREQVENIVGGTTEMIMRPAPEHERAGNA